MPYLKMSGLNTGISKKQILWTDGNFYDQLRLQELQLLQ